MYTLLSSRPSRGQPNRLVSSSCTPKTIQLFRISPGVSAPRRRLKHSQHSVMGCKPAHSFLQLARFSHSSIHPHRLESFLNNQLQTRTLDPNPFLMSLPIQKFITPLGLYLFEWFCLYPRISVWNSNGRAITLSATSKWIDNVKALFFFFLTNSHW